MNTGARDHSFTRDRQANSAGTDIGSSMRTIRKLTFGRKAEI